MGTAIIIILFFFLSLYIASTVAAKFLAALAKKEPTLEQSIH